MDKEKKTLILKIVAIILVIGGMTSLGILFVNKFKTKLDKTKPVFEVVEERSDKVVGKITSLLKKGEDINILIENSKEEAEDKIDLTVTIEKTTIIKDKKLCKIEDIEIGDRVEATYEIPAGKINKVAKKIIILGK